MDDGTLFLIAHNVLLVFFVFNLVFYLLAVCLSSRSGRQLGTTTEASGATPAPGVWETLTSASSQMALMGFQTDRKTFIAHEVSELGNHFRIVHTTVKKNNCRENKSFTILGASWIKSLILRKVSKENLPC